MPAQTTKSTTKKATAPKPPAATTTDPLAELREKIAADRAAGLTVIEIASKHGVSTTSVQEIIAVRPSKKAAEAAEQTKRAEAKKSAPKPPAQVGPTASPPKPAGSKSTEDRDRVAAKTVEVAGLDTPIVCRTCSTEKPARQFPTVKEPGRRGTECRKCRDARRDKREVAAAAQ